MIISILHVVINELEIKEVIVHKAIRSTQSDIYIFSDKSSSIKFVLKVFNTTYKYNSLESVYREFNSLTKFYYALRRNRDLGILAPKPIKLFLEHWAYVMEYIEGSSLIDFLCSKADNNSWSVISKRIVQGLKIYLDNVGHIYGDFQPSNIIIKDNFEVAMIDPTIPNIMYEMLSQKYEPLAVDIGYWVFTVAAKTLKYIILNRRCQLALLRFSKQLVQIAQQVSTTRTFLSDVMSVAQYHFNRILKTSPIKGSLLFLPFLFATKFMVQE